MEKKEQEVTGVQATLKGSATMATYNTAVEKFSKSSSSFMEMLQHLSQARDAYQEAITASAELRNVLDAGDEALRTIMSNLEQAIDVNLGRQPMDKKKPERAKVEPIGGNGEGAGVMKTWPPA